MKYKSYSIQYLTEFDIIGEDEATKLDNMMFSKDQELRMLAKMILVDRWKVKFPLSTVTTSSHLFQEETGYKDE